MSDKEKDNKITNAAELKENIEYTGPQERWGPKTLARNFRKLEYNIKKNEEALLLADEHVKTIIEIKIVFKWLKTIAIILTTVAGSVVALKTLGVFE
jgi:hypothetical protein